MSIRSSRKGVKERKGLAREAREWARRSLRCCTWDSPSCCSNGCGSGDGGLPKGLTELVKEKTVYLDQGKKRREGPRVKADRATIEEDEVEEEEDEQEQEEARA